MNKAEVFGWILMVLSLAFIGLFVIWPAIDELRKK